MRYRFTRRGRKVLKYMVQLECETRSGCEEVGWKEVIRFDNWEWHNGCHRHVFRSNGEKRCDPVDIHYDETVGYADALTEAQREINEYWELYCERFKNGGWPV